MDLTNAHRLIALLTAPLLIAGTAIAGPVDTRLYHGMHWRQLGPFRAGWAEMIQGVSSKPNTFYFGASGGGVWRTDDAGNSWESLLDQGGSSAIGAFAIAPSNPDVIYIGGGQPEPRYDVQAGRGVYKSADGGQSWTDLGLHDTRYIGRIWVSPTNSNLLLVGAVGHFFGVSDARGIYRSADGGHSWSHPLAPGGFTGVNDIVSDPANSQLLFASTWEARQWPWQSYFTEISGPGSGLWRSGDSGIHWRRQAGAGWPTGPLGRISLAATRKGGALRLYAVIDSKTKGGLWRSDDAGAHWLRVNSEKAFAGYYFNRVTVDPKDPDVVYLVGQSMRRCDRAGARCVIFRGSPGGDDYHSIWVDPKNPGHMAEGSDQGAAISVNGTKTWSSWYNQPTGQFYHLASDNRFPYWIYSGQQDSGTVGIASRSDYGAPNLRDWHPVGGDERDYDIPDPLDPEIIYGSGLGGHVSRWDARTGTVADISPWPVSNYGLRPTTVAHHFNWVTPLVASRAGPPALYLGGEAIFKTLDRGSSWTIISPDLTGKQPGAARCTDDVAIGDAKACGYGTIISIQPSPLSADELWVGTDTGLLQVTRDGGGHWTQLPLPGVEQWSQISSIDLSSTDRATAYVSVDGHRIDDLAPHIFATHDGGRTWRAITAGLPSDQVVGVVRADPVRPGLLYAGNETSAFVSFDDGDNWQPIRQNLPTAWVRDLLVHGDELVAATQGRALWVLNDLALLRQVTPAIATENAHLFAPAATYHVRFDNNRDTPLAPETPVGENPPSGVNIDFWLNRTSTQPVMLEIRDASGGLVRRFSSADQPDKIAANRYFAEGWTKPQPMLAATSGIHHWLWDMRWTRPKAVEYGYSIAAVWGKDTPLLPEGQLVAPGRYTAVLTVDGTQQSQQFDVLPDPRVVNADYAAAARFSTALYAPMSKAWIGYGEMKAVQQQLVTTSSQLADPVLGAKAKAFAARLEPSDVPNSGFSGESGTLASLETAVEASDSAPSLSQQAIAAQTIAAIDSDWFKWQQFKANDLATLNRSLFAAGQAQIAVPAEKQLNPDAPAGGEDLP